MMGDVRTANELGILLAARRPEWDEFTFRTDGAAVPVTVKDAPNDPNDGIDLNNSPRVLINVDLREDVARYGTRVRVTTVDDTATYSVTIDGLQFDYSASGGDGAQEIVEGLRDSINAGVSLGSLSLTFADANPDTVTRAAGDWTADGVDAGAQLSLDSDGDPNDGLTVTVASRTTTVVTCIATDVVTAEGPTSYTVTAYRQVTASVETRDGTPTLVIVTKLGDEQSPTPDDDELELLARDTTTQTVSVSATGTGALEYDQDATTCDVEVYGYDGGVSNAAKPDRWHLLNNGEFTTLDYRGFSERFTMGGFSRADLAIRNADGIVRATGGPAIDE